MKKQITLPLVLLFHFCFSQNQKAIDPVLADEHFSHGNFVMALPIYKELVKQQPKNTEYNYKAGMCYLNTNFNKAAAAPYLEAVCSNPKANAESFFYLGKAYQFGNKFTEAINAYEKCRQNAKGTLRKQAERQIETCNNAKEIMKYPLDVSYINLGKQINSSYPDYNPLLPADESFMLFTSRRPESSGSQVEIDGYYQSDIYISVPKDGVWQKPKNIGKPVNTRFDEEAVALTPNGKTMCVYLDDIDSLGNIYSSEISKNNFSKLIKFNENVNSGFESSGSLSPDGNIIFFASKRTGTIGESDIYMVKKLPNGKWAVPQNLGNKINTIYAEDYPRMVENYQGKILYFASQGHTSIGGFDIFKSIYNEDENTWSSPQNLGYPINTPNDEMCISITADSSYGYLSTTRDDGFGDLDLYKIKFNKDRARYSLMTGYVTTADTMGPYVKKAITAAKADTKEVLKFVPIKSTGKYVMALTPGNYVITVKAEGYEDYNYLLTIIDIPIQPEQQKDFQLTQEVKPK